MVDAAKASLSYRNGELLIVTPQFPHSIPGAAITGIMECRMADSLDHGEETFHVLLTKDEMLLAGPFIAGVLGALDGLRLDYPAIPTVLRLVRNIPWRFRDAEFLWLRPFPVAGLFVAPRSDLSAFEFVPEHQVDE